MTSDDLDGQLARLSGLGEAQRRRLYAYLAESGSPVSRDEAAAAIGISRPLAAYHLDRLAEDGLLDVRFERRTGRRGPGAGRPAKLYFRSPRPVEVSVPAREYAFMGEALARAVERDSSGSVRAGLLEVAREMGASAADEHSAPSGGQQASLEAALRALGYEPYDDSDGTLRLRNCPFDSLAESHRDLVCTANLAVVEGITSRLETGARPCLDPRSGECCVAVVRGGRSGAVARGRSAEDET